MSNLTKSVQTLLDFWAEHGNATSEAKQGDTENELAQIREKLLKVTRELELKQQEGKNTVSRELLESCQLQSRTLETELNSTKTDLNKLIKENKKLHDELSTRESRLSKVQLFGEAQKKVAEQCQTNLNAKNNELIALQSQLRKIREKLREQKQEHEETLRDQKADFETKLSTSEINVQKAKLIEKECNNLREETQAQERLINELRGTLDTAAARNVQESGRNLKQLQEEKRKTSEYEQKFTQCQKSLEILQTEVRESDAASQKEIKSLETKNSQLSILRQKEQEAHEMKLKVVQETCRTDITNINQQLESAKKLEVVRERIIASLQRQLQEKSSACTAVEEASEKQILKEKKKCRESVRNAKLCNENLKECTSAKLEAKTSLKECTTRTEELQGHLLNAVELEDERNALVALNKKQAMKLQEVQEAAEAKEVEYRNIRSTNAELKEQVAQIQKLKEENKKLREDIKVQNSILAMQTQMRETITQKAVREKTQELQSEVQRLETALRQAQLNLLQK